MILAKQFLVLKELIGQKNKTLTSLKEETEVTQGSKHTNFAGSNKQYVESLRDAQNTLGRLTLRAAIMAIVEEHTRAAELDSPDPA